jgi:hypothetical protein
LTDFTTTATIRATNLYQGKPLTFNTTDGFLRLTVRFYTAQIVFF